MTIFIPVNGHTIDAELEAGTNGIVWIHELRATTGERIVSWDLNGGAQARMAHRERLTRRASGARDARVLER